MRKLTDAEYQATTVPRPLRLGADEEPPFDFWPYLAAIPAEDLGGYDFSAGEVPYVWDMPSTPYQHVLVRCEAANVFLVLVLDRHERAVAGHHLLDLNALYGLG